MNSLKDKVLSWAKQNSPEMVLVASELQDFLSALAVETLKYRDPDKYFDIAVNTKILAEAIKRDLISMVGKKCRLSALGYREIYCEKCKKRVAPIAPNKFVEIGCECRLCPKFIKWRSKFNW